jgi:dimethylhistidine N-methyltransferase
LRQDYPTLAVTPLVADFTEPERLPVWRQQAEPWVGFFPGSTLGNLSRAGARRFLSRAARLLRGGGLLIGVDLVKDPQVLHAAYNDAAGITAAFNRNLLARANRELGSDFALADLQHYAFYNVPEQRVEMHLVAGELQQVSLLGQHFALGPGESIRTEISQKYTIEGFRALATACGFQPRGLWCDPDRMFSLHWLASVA